MQLVQLVQLVQRVQLAQRLALSLLSLVIAIPSLSACSLARSPILATPSDASIDGPNIDVPGLDATIDAGTDAPTLDAPELDAPTDGGSDVPGDARCSTGPDRDDDGVRDACDPCPDDPLDDSDGDGTCDGVDACPGHDDGVDADGDAVPDGCDDWPCGPRPTVGSPVTADGITIRSLALNGGGRTVVVAPGARISTAIGYTIEDCGCDGCIDQIEVGTVPGGRAFCAYDANPPECPDADMGNHAGELTAPMTPGRYDVRFRKAQDYGCYRNGRTDWWLEAPDGARTIGVICVR